MSAFDDYLSGETYQKKKADKEKANELLGKILDEQLAVREVLEDIADLLEVLVSQKEEAATKAPVSTPDVDKPQPLQTTTIPAASMNDGQSAFTNTNLGENFLAHAGAILGGAKEGPAPVAAGNNVFAHAQAILGG